MRPHKFSMRARAKDQRPVKSREFSPSNDRLNWNKLLRKIDFLSLKVLDHIYLKDELTLHELARSLTTFGVCSTTIKNRLDRLESWNLVEVVTETNPLCLVKKFRFEEGIKKLIVLGYGKFEVKRGE